MVGFILANHCTTLALSCACVKACNDIRLECKNTVVLEPEEHDFLEICLSCLEEPLELVKFGQLNDLQDFT